MSKTKCPNCRFSAPKRAEACPKCGASFVAPTPPPRRPVQPIAVANSPSTHFSKALSDFILVLYGVLVTYIFFMFADFYVAGLQSGLREGRPIGEVWDQSLGFHGFIAFALVSLFALADAADIVVRNQTFQIRWNSRYVFEILVLGGYFFSFIALRQQTMHFLPGFAFVLFFRSVWIRNLLREQESEGSPVSAEQERFLLHERGWIAAGTVLFGGLGIALVLSVPNGLTTLNVQWLKHFWMAMLVWWGYWTITQWLYLDKGSDGISISLIPRLWRKKHL